jgi:hypothetical protein
MLQAEDGETGITHGQPRNGISLVTESASQQNRDHEIGRRSLPPSFLKKRLAGKTGLDMAVALIDRICLRHSCGGRNLASGSWDQWIPVFTEMTPGCPRTHDQTTQSSSSLHPTLGSLLIAHLEAGLDCKVNVL